jgi:formiminotetrahydrofolate cyclodeaminase
VAAQAVALRERVAPFADETAAAYADVLGLLAEPNEEAQERRDFRLGAAFARAAAVPLLIAEAASDVAELGLFVVERGDPERRPDAAAAVLLADAAARIAAHLVAVNLSAQSDDERAVRAKRAAEATADASRRALAAT